MEGDQDLMTSAPRHSGSVQMEQPCHTMCTLRCRRCISTSCSKYVAHRSNQNSTQSCWDHCQLLEAKHDLAFSCIHHSSHTREAVVNSHTDSSCCIANDCLHASCCKKCTGTRWCCSFDSRQQQLQKCQLQSPEHARYQLPGDSAPPNRTTSARVVHKPPPTGECYARKLYCACRSLQCTLFQNGDLCAIDEPSLKAKPKKCSVRHTTSHHACKARNKHTTDKAGM